MIQPNPKLIDAETDRVLAEYEQNRKRNRQALEYLRQCGFLLVHFIDERGQTHWHALEDDVGLVKPTGEDLFIFHPSDSPFNYKRTPAYYVGTLFFAHPPIGASGRDWVLEVRGRTHMQDLGSLARQLASKYDVRVNVRLKTEEVMPHNIDLPIVKSYRGKSYF